MPRCIILLVIALLAAGCKNDWTVPDEDVDAALGSGRDAGPDGSIVDGGARDSGPEGDGEVATGFTVESITPAEGTALDDVLGVISVTFSHPLDASTVTPSSFKVLREGRAIAGTRRVSGRTATFEAVLPWVLGVTYDLELAASITDAEARSLEPRPLSFTVRDGSWQPARRLDGAHNEHHLAVAAGGRAALVWTKLADGNKTEIWASRFAPGSNWTGATLISQSLGGPHHSRPEVALNDEGPIVSVWYHYDQVATAAHVDGSWSTTRAIANGYKPSLALTPTGGAYATLQGTPSNDLILHAFTPGQMGGSTATLAADAPVTMHEARLSLFGDVPIALWEGAAGHNEIWARIRGEEPDLVSNEDVEGRTARLAVEPGANSAVAVWEQIDPGWTNIWAARMPRDGVFGEPVQVSTDSTDATQPSIAVDQKGRALAVWEQADGSTTKIMAASLEAESGWTPPVQVSSDGGGTARQPVVAMEAGGHAIVVWTQADAADPAKVDAWVARYVAGEGFVTAQRKVLSTTRNVLLGTYQGGNIPSPGRPCAGVDTMGRAFASWIEDGGVWVARFE
jgi:hypothetical protein